MVLDYLLNARETLERVDRDSLAPGGAYSQGWSYPLNTLVGEASIFLRSVLGEHLHSETMALLFEADLQENCQSTEIVATLANAIRAFLPLFMRTGRYESLDNEEVIVSIIEDLMGIHWGDEPRFFSILPRRQGQHKRLYRLNRLRLSALDWDKFLATVGMAAYERHRIISDAYRTEWEAIRKWAAAVESQYGFRSWPPRDAEWAMHEFETNREGVMTSIRRDGEAYWLEKSAAHDGR